ncbi:substrate-binding domain-containing protein [Bartonella sp. TP]|uniref:PstS family phosphate ABC transporter substrate-binding protein n=1 Tax=Bartonella sp. TP TaxID=3057550 RepID=UPI0025B165C6|nr:substrate-binding domain-containing protein [Bartonella sp. TP]WJW80375.1 substrate-binding domain-containing protein [Bartonella sp. TP]
MRKLRAVFLFWCFTCLAFYFGFAGYSYGAEQIRISGSSTVFPYAKVVADEFHEIYPNFKVPVVESGGSGSGIKEFCRSDSEDSLDIVNASRPMNASELQACFADGVRDTEQIIFGYDGIVFATSKNASANWALEAADVYRALAAKVVRNGVLIDNNFNSWQEINKNLPNWPIETYIPGEKHGTREVFEEKLLLAGCKTSGAASLMAKMGLSPAFIKTACVAVRRDGKAIDVDGDYSETLARLDANKTAVGVFGLAFYESNADKLDVATVNKIKPTAQSVASGVYSVSRPLYFYVKKSHLPIRPGLKEYVDYFLSEAMIGEDGEVVDYGLVPAPKQQRVAQRKAFAAGVILQNAK